MYAEHATIAVDLYTVVKIQLQPVLSFTTSSPLLQFVFMPFRNIIHSSCSNNE
ncbi:hypothetical protein T09_8937 [Trichinella sp. T9]|nr:hypothetical protein T09_8937 [Trichinella sp. T9]